MTRNAAAILLIAAAALFSGCAARMTGADWKTDLAAPRQAGIQPRQVPLAPQAEAAEAKAPPPRESVSGLTLDQALALADRLHPGLAR